MAYLSNSTISVDAIITQKGRSLLAKGKNQFKITKFALGDSEIDYNLWNASHPMGTDYYGVAIESLPILEAVPDESQMMKYKLVTLSKNTTKIPVIEVIPDTITLVSPGQSAIITPTTVNYANGNATLGYTAILANSDAAYLTPAPGKEISKTIYSQPVQDNLSSTSVAITGFGFQVIAKNQPYTDLETTITIIGNETGGRKVVTLIIRKTDAAVINTNNLSQG